jgi:hypothetical protein
MITKEYEARKKDHDNNNDNNILTSTIHISPLEMGSSSIQKVLHQL